MIYLFSIAWWFSSSLWYIPTTTIKLQKLIIYLRHIPVIYPLDTHYIPIIYPSGWWLTYPSEKWWSSSAGIMTFPIFLESHKIPWFQTTNKIHHIYPSYPSSLSLNQRDPAHPSWKFVIAPKSCPSAVHTPNFASDTGQPGLTSRKWSRKWIGSSTVLHKNHETHGKIWVKIIYVRKNSQEIFHSSWEKPWFPVSIYIEPNHFQIRSIAIIAISNHQ